MNDETFTERDVDTLLRAHDKQVESLEECEHHSIDKHRQCLDCGMDMTADLADAAEYAGEAARDRLPSCTWGEA